MGADDIEYADHDGQATPDKAYQYFSEVLSRMPDPAKHVFHHHMTRGWGLANILAAMLDQMGIEHGLDVDKVLETGRVVERILGQRLRSQCVTTGRIPKGPTDF